MARPRRRLFYVEKFLHIAAAESKGGVNSTRRQNPWRQVFCSVQKRKREYSSLNKCTG
jgi:hypothetical protein